MLAVSVAVCARGGEESSAASTAGTVGTASDSTQLDQPLFEKMAAVWSDNDVAAAKEIYAPDAVAYWVDSAASPRNTGIDDISAAVQRFSVSLVPVAGIHAYTLSSRELPQLGPFYGDVYYIAGPVAREGQVYMVVVEIRDGKIADQWATPITGTSRSTSHTDLVCWFDAPRLNVTEGRAAAPIRLQSYYHVGRVARQELA